MARELALGDGQREPARACALPRTRSSGRREAVQASTSMSSLAEARLASPIVDCCFAGVVGVWNVAGGRVLRVPSSDERPSAPPRRRARHRSALAQRGTDRCSSFTSPTVVCRPTARRRAPGTASPVAPAVSSSKALGRGRRRPGERRRVVRTDQAWIARTPLERFDRTIYSPARTRCMLTNHGSLASGQGAPVLQRIECEMAPGMFEQQTWPRRAARGVMLAASGLATVRQQKGVAAGDAQDRSRAPRDHLTAVIARRDPIRVGIAREVRARGRWVNGEVLAMPGRLSCESAAHGPAAG